MKRICLFFILALMVFFSVFSCKKSAKSAVKSENIDNSLVAVKQKKVFVLGLDDSFPPMGYRNEKNEIVGFDIDVASEVCRRMGVELKSQPIDWNAKELELSSGNIDCIWNGFTITDDRRKELLFSEPYLVNRQVYVVNKDSGIKSDSDLAGKSVGVQAGSTGAIAFEKSEICSKANVVEYKDFLTALQDLQVGGIDAVVIDSVVAKENMRLSKASNLKILDGSLADEQYGIGFRKGDKALRDEIQKYLDEMKKDGSVEKIADKYGIVL